MTKSQEKQAEPLKENTPPKNNSKKSSLCCKIISCIMTLICLFLFCESIGVTDILKRGIGYLSDLFRYNLVAFLAVVLAVLVVLVVVVVLIAALIVYCVKRNRRATSICLDIIPFIHLCKMSTPDAEPVMRRGNEFGQRTRTWSGGSIDPYEDPVSGLERVSSRSQLNRLSRRRREDEERLRHRIEPPVVRREALSSMYESLNYEIAENELYKAEEKKPMHHLDLWRQSRNRWIVCFFIGVFTAFVAASIDILLHYSKTIKFDIILRGLMDRCDEQARLTGAACLWEVEAAWIVYDCVLVGIAAFLVIWVSPIAGGSGIPQIKCYLNGVRIPNVVGLKTLVAKAVGVACAVGGGLAAGKEGPMIHSGGVVAAGVSQGKCALFGCDIGLFKEFRNDRERRDFVSAGAAAGVAAAFGAPIGGTLFSLEEGASFWNQNLTWRMFFSAMISSFTVNWILSWFNGKSGWLSWTGLANFGVFEKRQEYNVWEVPFFLMIGILGGISGALFNYLNTKLAEFRKKYVSNPWQRLFEALLVAAVSAFLAFATLYIVDDCKPIGISPNHTQVTQLWCKKNEYSAVADLFFSMPEESVKNLLHSPINSYRTVTLIVFAIEYFVLTLWTFGLAVPGGIFIPALLTGAAWGRLIGIAIEGLFPNVTGISPGKYALAGAAAQLGGIVRMTISLTAIIIEATKDITFGLPIMLVLMIAKWVGDMFNEGIYDTLIDLAEVPVLGWHPPKMSRNILAEKVMRSDVIAVEPRIRVNRLLQILSTTKHHGFPVVDRIEESPTNRELPDYGHVKGIILREQIMKLLRNRVFTPDMDSPDTLTRQGNIILADFLEENHDDMDLKNLPLTYEDEQCWVDLTPIMHPHPLRVTLNASLPFIYRIFRYSFS
ncbi:hypothetical protein WR25_14410 isoform B [Diploscapter pachys]|uniref:Chloride channel protein n=1 Tax=Diploscapter pachys TaxID=2018661 RepID=A0A2A2JGJ0_9BILA|nr:hypothetical protein WR25_14410 isoform A [Diploscapter pachys]PAV60643.1 hypothetical protein WR25_14410 isoform B [Diploscapter pachys]